MRIACPLARGFASRAIKFLVRPDAVVAISAVVLMASVVAAQPAPDAPTESEEVAPDTEPDEAQAGETDEAAGEDVVDDEAETEAEAERQQESQQEGEGAPEEAVEPASDEPEPTSETESEEKEALPEAAPEESGAGTIELAPEAAVVDDEGEVEEITVRARKRDETLQSVPVAVTSFSETRLERGTVRDLQDLEALAPNVIIDPVPVTPGGAALAIRGVGFSDTEKTFDPAVGVILDGVYLGTNSTQLLNNFDFESVEILRGPQGTLFGRNTTAGAIVVRRTRPTGEFGVKANAIVGSYGRHDYKGVINFPIVRDSVAGKISIYSLNQDGWLNDLGRNTSNPGQQYLSGAFDLLLTPTEDFELLLKYERIYERSESQALAAGSDEEHILCFGPPAGLTTFSTPQCAALNPEIAQRGPYDVASSPGIPNNQDMDLDAITMQAEYDMGDFQLVSITGWRGHDEDVFQDIDATEENFFTTRRTQRYDQVSEELRLHGNPVESVNFVVGAYYWFAHYDLNQTLFYLFDQPFIQAAAGVPLPPGTVRIQNSGQETHSIAGFSQADWEFVDNLRLTVGARYTYEQKKFNNDWDLSNSEDPNAAAFLVQSDTTVGITAEESWKRFTPKVGLDYTLPASMMGDHGAMVYTSYARGFKSGGFNGRADPPTEDTFGQETVDQFEVGFKTSWARQRLMLNAAAFWTMYNDKQEEVVLPSETGGQQTLTRNAADATIRGVEVEMSTTPIRGQNRIVGGLRLWGNVGLLDAFYDKFVADLNGPDPMTGELNRVDNSDMELRQAPAWQFAVGIDNPYEIADFGRIVANVQYRRRAKQRVAFTFEPGTNTPDSRGIAPEWGQLDASLGVEADDLLAGSWRLTAFGRALTQETGKTAYLNVGGLFAFNGTPPPRMWGVELQAMY